jgi:hypothetical protein
MNGKRMIISKNAKSGQLIATVIFSGIFLLIVLLAIVSKNYNYLLIVAVGVVGFLPAYMYSLKFFDISMDCDYIYFNKLFSKEERVLREKFKEVTPLKFSLPTVNNRTFSFTLKDGRSFWFNYKSQELGFLPDRYAIAKSLSSQIEEFADRS